MATPLNDILSAQSAAVPLAMLVPRAGAAEFLASAGWAEADVQPLAGDASFRHYFRVRGEQGDAVLMDAPPDKEDSHSFVTMAQWLLQQGFSAPRILAADLAQGFLLIEDFGNRLVGPELARQPDLEAGIYAQAVQLLGQLQQAAPPAELRRYDRPELLREVRLFPQWYGKALQADFDDASYVAAWDAVWGQVIRETQAAPVVTLRDYHVDNLMLLERSGVQALGLLDFQDALAGHPAYDLVSLLQDARRDVAPQLEADMLARYGQWAGIADADSFRACYEVLGAQRNVKILGVFVRLKLRDGRQGYVERLPRVWGYLQRNFAHPALAPVRDWFDRHVPASMRRATFE